MCVYFEYFQSSSRKQQAYETFSSLFAFSHSSPKNREFENPKERSTFCQIYVALETDC